MIVFINMVFNLGTSNLSLEDKELIDNKESVGSKNTLSNKFLFVSLKKIQFLI